MSCCRYCRSFHMSRRSFHRPVIPKLSWIMTSLQPPQPGTAIMDLTKYHEILLFSSSLPMSLEQQFTPTCVSIKRSPILQIGLIKWTVLKRRKNNSSLKEFWNRVLKQVPHFCCIKAIRSPQCGLRTGKNLNHDDDLHAWGGSSALFNLHQSSKLILYGPVQSYIDSDFVENHPLAKNYYQC